MKIIKFIICAVLLTFGSAALALPVPGYNSPVTDQAGILSSSARQQIEQKILAYRDASNNQIGVLIIKSLDGEPIEDFAHDVYVKWGIGEKGKDNGVLFLMSIDDRQTRLEVGYGLEGELTDLESGRLIGRQSVMADNFGRVTLTPG